MSIQIEENVPMPENSKNKKEREMRYPLPDLLESKPGASFAIKDSDDVKRDLSRLRGAVVRYCKTRGINNVFRVSTDPEGNPRVWRLDADPYEKKESKGKKSSGKRKQRSQQQSQQQAEGQPETVE